MRHRNKGRARRKCTSSQRLDADVVIRRNGKISRKKLATASQSDLKGRFARNFARCFLALHARYRKRESPRRASPLTRLRVKAPRRCRAKTVPCLPPCHAKLRETNPTQIMSQRLATSRLGKVVALPGAAYFSSCGGPPFRPQSRAVAANARQQGRFSAMGLSGCPPF